MRDSKTILLTGITGAVGSWIAAEALRAGDKVLAVVRDTDSEDARQRVRSVLESTDAGDRWEEVELVRGDICEGLSGIEDDLRKAGVTSVFHSAALTDFSGSNLELSRKINVEGTRHVLETAERLGAEVCYISTAYIAGKRGGVVREDEIDKGQDFNNVYERTKCEAEVFVKEWSERTGLKTFIIRPSIVIGEQRTGRIANFSGMYKILRFFDVARKAIGNEMIRVAGKKDVTKNLIPVDYLVEALWYIFENGEPDTYHITNPEPITMGQLRDIYIDIFDLTGDLVEEEAFDEKKASRAESMFQKASALYLPYFAAEPVFDRTNTDRVLEGSGLELPRIDKAYFKLLLGYARSVKWGKAKPEATRCKARLGSIEEYFSDFLGKKLNERLLEDLKGLSAKFRIVLREQPKVHWTLEVDQGRLVTVSDNGMLSNCSFVVGSEALRNIVSAKVTPQEAFFKKEVEITGDMETGLKLVTVLAGFFREFPCEIG